MSYRSEIKNAVKDLLIGRTQAGTNILATLDRPINEDDLPIIVLYTTESKRGKEDFGRGLLMRVVTLCVEAALKTDSAYTAEATAEAFSDVVEDILDADPSWANRVHDSRWQSTTSDVSSVGHSTIANVLLEYEVEYLTSLKDESYFGQTDDGFTEPPDEITIKPGVTPADPTDGGGGGDNGGGGVTPDPCLSGICNPDFYQGEA